MSNKLILLAEDNLVNQKVTLRQLEKLGYTADVVSDGFMALDALLRASYDLVLMDCQMPEMDGYETTAEIRRREATTRHTPIIAMTAHALEGDREKCLAAGMDDYISKPVKYEELGKVLAEWLPDAPNADEVSGSSAQAALPPVDMERLFCAMGDDPEEMQEILDIYLEQMAESVQKLSAAVEAGDAVQLKLVAHNCAGVSANCGMTALVAPLRELERRGREGWIGDTAQLLKQISQELARTKLFLQEQLGQLTFG